MNKLNQTAAPLVADIVAQADMLRVAVHHPGGAVVVDCGVATPGGLEAGRRLAEVTMAGLGQVQLAPADRQRIEMPLVTVRTDHPVAACMGSQYAGWQVQVGDFFAMGSGPMRAVGSREPLIDELQFRQSSTVAIGVLEASQLPGEEVCDMLAQACGVPAAGLSLLVAPTNSQAGNVQVVARSVETALHKLHELGFDLSRIESGWGTAPLPPVAADPLAGIGRTNDAILYGGHALLYVRGDDDSLRQIGPQTPSSASDDHGEPFADLFARYDHDFYKIDKLLFSPAMVTFVNLDTGRTHRFGNYEPSILRHSFIGS
jgi:methenyltetrahydromethanopterin cyclohydrolase